MVLSITEVIGVTCQVLALIGTPVQEQDFCCISTVEAYFQSSHVKETTSLNPKHWILRDGFWYILQGWQKYLKMKGPNYQPADTH